MARRSLKPQLNQIRAWVRQGRTDAWIAHQLEVSASELREFRNQHGLTPDEEDAGSSEVDLRDEIEAEIEAATAEEAEAEEDEEAEAEDDEDDDERRRGARTATEAARRRPRRRRRRGRRGGRGRRKELEATFDHGETDGYGLWLDPAVKDNPVYAEHWAGQREVTVRIEPDQIVIRRAGRSPSRRADDSTTTTRRVAQSTQLPAAGEVAGAAQVEPEGRVGERLRVGLAAGADVDRDLQAPVGAARRRARPARRRVKVGPIRRRSSSRIASTTRSARRRSRGSSQRLQRAPALLPLEERVLERVAHRREITRRPSASGRRRVGIAQAARCAGPQAAGSSSPRTFQTVTGPLRWTGATAGSPRSQRGLGRGDRVARGG